MPNINTGNFTLTNMTTKRSLASRLEGYRISVKDFGAIGDGSADDTAAIQAAFNYAFGTEASPHGDTNSGLNKIVFFPAGDYKITTTLELNWVYGGTLLGAGSHQTRLFWSGAEYIQPDTVSSNPADASGSSLLEARTCWHSHLEGFTLDASSTQQVAYRLISYPPYVPGVYENSGHDGIYRDMHFTNAIYGISAGGIAMSSERLYIGCRFTNCTGAGVLLPQQNALNHSFYGCSFDNNLHGYNQVGGGAGEMFGCRFSGNQIDIHGTEVMMRIAGCYSTSKNFASVDGVLVGNKHVNASAGVFWTPATSNIPADGVSGPPWLSTGTSTGRVILKGNQSSNGYLLDGTGGHNMHLMGNVFGNSNYLTGLIATNTLWVDGVKILP